MKKVVLLLNMGGPNNLAEVRVFLKNMFNDPNIITVKNNFLRSILASLIVNIRAKSAIKNYEELGGKSPIQELTKNLCEKIKLKNNSEFDIDFVMNYTRPFAKDVLKKYRNYDEIVLFALYPHHSNTTVKSSINDAIKVIKSLNSNSFIKIVDIFYSNNRYNRIILDLIKDKISCLSKNDIAKTSFIFSAHSLPKKMVEKGDIYEKQVNEHVKILQNMLANENIKFKEILLAYQSRLGPVKWLGPSLNDVLYNLKSKRALIFPISFCIDNSETNFELGIEYKKIADKLNYEFYDVVKCPNDTDEFAEFIIDKSKT